MASWEVIDAEVDPEPIEVDDGERHVVHVHTAVTFPNGVLRLVDSHHLLTEQQLAKFYATYLPATDV